jgi:predicted amidohydrolase
MRTRMERYLAAAVQMSSGPDRAANVARATALVREAVARGARLVVLPEVFAWRGPRADEESIAEPVPGPTTEAFAALARTLGIHLCAGSLLERAPGDSRAYNTSCLFGPHGELLARYRRLVRAGAEVLLVPSAFTFPTGAAHWEVLCRARAIENQCYLIAPDQTGTSPHGFADFGDSLIADPWGRVIARAGDGEAVVTAEIDRTYLARVRRELPCLAHARLAV